MGSAGAMLLWALSLTSSRPCHSFAEAPRVISTCKIFTAFSSKETTMLLVPRKKTARKPRANEDIFLKRNRRVAGVGLQLDGWLDRKRSPNTMEIFLHLPSAEYQWNVEGGGGAGIGGPPLKNFLKNSGASRWVSWGGGRFLGGGGGSWTNPSPPCPFNNLRWAITDGVLCGSGAVPSCVGICSQIHLSCSSPIQSCHCSRGEWPLKDASCQPGLLITMQS